MTGHWDAVVAGAGPAGSTLALRLARRGWHVVLLDAARFPRHKVCGEYISAAAGSLLAELGLDAAVARQAVRLDTLKIVLPSGRAISAEFGPPTGNGAPERRPSSLSRFQFDDLLLQAAIAAGVEFRDNLRVRQVHIDQGRATGLEAVSADHSGAPLAVSADWIIAADGRRSLIVQQTGGVHGRPQQQVGFKQHFRCDADAPRTLEMHSLRGGYVGVSPVEDGLWNVCGVLPRSLVQQARGALDEALRAWSGMDTPLAGFLQKATAQGPWLSIAEVTTQRALPYVGRTLYVGDAAGTIEPLAGQGMTMALASAALADQFLTNPAGDPREYFNAWRQAFGPRVRRASLLAALLRRPRLLAGLVTLQRFNARLAASLVGWGYESVSTNHDVRFFPSAGCSRIGIGGSAKAQT